MAVRSIARALALLPAAAISAAPASAWSGVETVTVTASALPSTALEAPTIHAETLDANQIARFGMPDVLGAMARGLAGVSLSEAQGNPFQPSVTYRGFEASPLTGDAQGLAVYVDGVRFNQAFGDTVEWSLIPAVAVARITMEGANPVFGLNALGGALSLNLKDGTAFQGLRAQASAGSFGRLDADAEYGANTGGSAVYLAASAYDEQGWRDHSPSRLAQVYGNFSWRGAAGSVHLDLIGADSDLTGNGTTPVQLLAVDRSAVFTYPDSSRNLFGVANLYGDLGVAARIRLQGNFYIKGLHRSTDNGDASDGAPCEMSPGLLCLDGNGPLLTDVSGDTIADFLHGGPYAQMNRTDTQTLGSGGTLQAVFDGGGVNILTGLSVDRGATDFSAESEIGALTAARGFAGPGIEIAQADGEIAPVSVDADNTYYGAYISATAALSDALSLKLAARENVALIALKDKRGTALDGSHRYSRLNPSAGFVYRADSAVSLYADYAEANRAPTPAEFSCADEAAPCSLTNFFVSDPALKQVVARTFELGLRGGYELGGDRALSWQAGAYRIDTRDDILFAASAIAGRAYFRNIGATRRQGIEIDLDYRGPKLSASLDYSYTDARFESALVLNSPDNPFADANGNIFVSPGDMLPGVPAHLLKLNADYALSAKFTVSAAAILSSGVWLEGDEANQNPQTSSYAVFDLGGRYRLSGHCELFVTAANIFNTDYATFGAFSPTSDVPIAQLPGAGNPRSLSPGPPRAVYGGVRLSL